MNELGDRHGAAQTLNNLANVHNARGQYDKAVELYEQSLATKNELGDEHGAANTLGNLAGVYQSRGQYDKAVELARAVRQGRRTVPNCTSNAWPPSRRWVTSTAPRKPLAT
eukprot:TRINITY_DN3027_c0_g1_i21.p2 TRINITY_DN3027_c0_g1~~TRINITY_DN3027_c0_g1_i21.p2  ORF type:complete len:111 (-),score=12.23 TRINITY_DN3027_c0_g1_i21:22-354(-)